VTNDAIRSSLRFSCSQALCAAYEPAISPAAASRWWRSQTPLRSRDAGSVPLGAEINIIYTPAQSWFHFATFKGLGIRQIERLIWQNEAKNTKDFRVTSV
jgi:hypothetical protein